MFNWIKALLLSAGRALKRNRADAERERERERGVCAARAGRETEQTQREREREVCARAGRETEQTQRERERERCVRALGEKLSRRRERERGVCARWESKTLRSRCSPGDSQKLGLGAVLKGKKSLKGSAMLLSWQHCASPFLQLRVGPRVKQKIRAALIAR